MKLDVNELLEILDGQKDVMEELIELAEKLSQALINDDLDEIVQITGRQEDKGRQMALMEQKRRSLLEEYSRESGMEINYLNDLSDQIKSDEQEKLQKIADEIKETHQKLKEVQERNCLLLKQSMVYVNRILMFFHSRKPGTYSKSGNIKRVIGKGNIDKSI